MSFVFSNARNLRALPSPVTDRSLRHVWHSFSDFSAESTLQLVALAAFSISHREASRTPKQDGSGRQIVGFGLYTIIAASYELLL